MKNIFRILLLILPLTSIAQTCRPDPDLDKFVGTWRWSSGNDEVTMTLQKQILVLPRGAETIEILVGWHSYIQNGIQKESSMQYIGQDVNASEATTAGDLKVTILGFSRSPTKIHFSTFWDMGLHKDCKLEFELLPGSTTQATWKLGDGGDLYTGPPGANGLFTLPRSLTLIKQ